MVQSREIQIGYKLQSEEFSASELVAHAKAAEQYGFQFALISDHYHPWRTALSSGLYSAGSRKSQAS